MADKVTRERLIDALKQRIGMTTAIERNRYRQALKGLAYIDASPGEDVHELAAAVRRVATRALRGEESGDG